MPDARLEVTDALGRRIVPISKALFEIGRRETNDLRLAGSEVSRDHALIENENAKFILQFLQLTAERGLSHVEQSRRTAEASGSGNLGEIT